jgi:hypothetical protein
MLTPMINDPTTRGRELRAQMAQGGYALPGSISLRHTRCQNPGCHCRAEPPELHGPYPTWTHKTGGKTITRTLDPDQAERYQTWIDAGRHLRELVAELEALSIEIAEAERWGRGPTTTSTTSRTPSR